MSFSTQNPFDEVEDTKMHVTFSITHYGKEVSLDTLYDETTSWGEILSDLTASLESSFGYSFDIPSYGIYYRGKTDDDSQ